MRSTCIGAGDPSLDGRVRRCVVVDEASQATEPAVLVALTRGSSFVVMAGDPQQLPPTLVSAGAYRHGLDVTLFERVANAGGQARGAQGAGGGQGDGVGRASDAQARCHALHAW